MLYRNTVLVAVIIGIGIISAGFVQDTSIFSVYKSDQKIEQFFNKSVVPIVFATADITKEPYFNDVVFKSNLVATITPETKILNNTNVDSSSSVRVVPFYSQFTDITAPEWKKVGCGIASLAMLIEYYQPHSVTVDELLQRGIDANAFLSDAGWTHSGLINLSHQYGLSGESHSLADSSMDEAFAVLKNELEEGPVMASVHYTFDPKNTIPHLVVVNAVRNNKVYYNDPSESVGGGSISIAQFQSSWKKRYIDIRPVS